MPIPGQGPPCPLNPSAAKKSLKQVTQLFTYMRTIGNPFLFGIQLINIVTHEHISSVSEYLLNLIQFAKRLYNDFHWDRLQVKTVSLFATISAKYKTVKPSVPHERSKKFKYLSKDVENNRANKYIQYAESRGKVINYILQSPITTRLF